MTELQTAMRNVDREPAVGGAGATLEMNRPKIARAIERAARADDDAFDDAHRIVQRAVARGGRDASEPQAIDSAAIRSIRDILIGVQAAQ